MTISVNRGGSAAKAMAAALTAEASAEDRAKEIEEAWSATISEIADGIRADFESVQESNDAAALAQRGYRQLTSAENKFYEAMTAILKSDAPKQEFANFLANPDFMPTTIIEDVMKDLEAQHELLSFIDFQYTGYATKWLRNKHGVAKAVWGAINGKITEEITSALRVLNISQNKLTAFAIVPLDILDMGYTFIDAYVRRCLIEAVYDGMEDGIINGKGVKDEPVGMIRDVHEGVNVSTTDGYPSKTAIEVTSFDVAGYCDLVGRMAKTEFGRNRTVPEVGIIVNTKTYLTKVRPATTFVGEAGYIADVFPYPTKVIQCNAVADDEAILALPKGYCCCIGGKRNGIIDVDDSCKFLDDVRAFKVIQHADGIADDNTSCLLLDISKLDPMAYPVKHVGNVAAGEVTA